MGYLDDNGLTYVWSKIKTLVSGKQDTSNLVTSISSSSDDTHYPSAKCVYDAIQNGGGGSLSWTQLASWTGNTATSVTLSGYSEVLVTCSIPAGSTPRRGSVVIPIGEISSSYTEWSVGFSSSVSSAIFGALFRITLTKVTPQWAYANGSAYSSSATWKVYAR